LSPECVDISIVIVNWHSKNYLVNCLRSLKKDQSIFTKEFILIENASNENICEIAEAYSDIKVIQNQKNTGFAHANNQGFTSCQGRYLLLLNPDTIILPGCIDELIEFMDNHPESGICGPLALNPDGTLQAGGNKFPNLISEINSLFGRGKSNVTVPPECLPIQVDWVGGACLLIRKEVYKKVGPLDEHFFMYCEETDWCWRVKKQGWEIYFVPKARYIHFGGQSSKLIKRKMLLQLYNSKSRLLLKHRGKLAGIIFFFFSHIVYLIKFLQKSH
jgi:GT2 family glycosyltransferase